LRNQNIAEIFSRANNISK